MAGNFGNVLMEFYRNNPAQRDAAGRRLGRIRRVQAGLYDEQGNPLPPDQRTPGAVLDLSSAQRTNAAERQAGVDQGLIEGQNVLNLARADRLATEEGIAGRDAAAEAEKRRVGNILATGFADPNSPEARAAAQAARNRLAPAAGGARTQGILLADAASHNPIRTEPELPGPATPMQGDVFTRIRDEAQKSALLTEQGGGIQMVGEGADRHVRYVGPGAGHYEAVPGEPPTYGPNGEVIAGTAAPTTRFVRAAGPDLATQARRQEGIERRLAEGRFVILRTEAEGRMATSEADRAAAEVRHAAAAATAAERVAGEAPVSMILGGGAVGGGNLEDAATYSELANKETDPERKQYFSDLAVQASGGQSVEEQKPAMAGPYGGVGGGLGYVWDGIKWIWRGQPAPTKRIVPRPASNSIPLYTSATGKHAPQAASREPRAASVLLPATPAAPAQHGAGTLTLGGEPAPTRGPLPSSTGLRQMTEEQFLQVLRSHPKDFYVRQEAKRRGRG